MWDAVDNLNHMCHMCGKGILDPNFNKAVIDKISDFNEITQIYIFRKIVFF